MKPKQKKTPSEYPMFAVRLTAEQKKSLLALVDNVREALNRRNKPNEKLWMKNAVIYEALMLGLPQIKKLGNRKE